MEVRIPGRSHTGRTELQQRVPPRPKVSVAGDVLEPGEADGANVWPSPSWEDG